MKYMEKRVSRLLRALGPAARIRIVLAIGDGEACVCHLVALLGWRQAYISQHLMELRKANVLKSRREGRFVYYRLNDKRILTLLQVAAGIAGVDLLNLSNPPDCPCPTCTPEAPGVHLIAV